MKMVQNTNEIIEVNNNVGKKVDDFAEHNITIRSIIENALFSQLSEIKVFLLDFETNVSQQLYNSKGKILPKIDYVELTLLNQGTNISHFKKFGFGLYVFFLYLINLLITFGVLLIFALHYIYNIFYKYYQDLDVECSLFFECNILSLASGVQIKKFRKYYINTFGKEEYLDKYKNFDVIYKEYLYTGTIVFIVVFLINFGYVLYLQKVYKQYKKENPEINSYTLILSGKNIPCIDNEIKAEDRKSEIQRLKEERKKEIKELLKVENLDIHFTLELSEFYKKMDEYKDKRNEKIKLQHRIKKGRCLCCCCSEKRLVKKEKELEDKINQIKEELSKIKSEEKYNPLYLLTFHDKSDYDHIYSEYPHSYIMKTIKGICQKETKNIYVDKAPNPEDIAWENLQFDKEYRYFKNKLINLGLSILYLIISFIIQLFLEIISNIGDSKIFRFIVNVIVSYVQDKLNDKFSNYIHKKLSENLNSWSYSNIEFYSILYGSIFKFINQGIFPLVTYYALEYDDDYSNLVSKMFVLIEMDGFGYPMLDLLHNVFNKKGKDMYEAQEKMLSVENVDKEFKEQIENKEGQTRFELEQSFEKPEMKLSENYREIVNIYWITMFYLPIYPIGIVQSFLNLLFIFIIEKNFLLNIYKRPEYINPHFGFLCFNFFNFGFFLFLCGDIIFFRNKDNKKSYGAGYIVIMVLILILPFFLLAKLILYLCSKKEKEENLKDIKQKMKSDYRIFNPCYQREAIKNLFSEFKENGTLEDSQYDELIEKKLGKLNSLDLFKLQRRMRIPKVFSFQTRKLESTFIYQNDSYEIEDEEKIKLYNLLMQLGFIPYLEEGNVMKPKKKKIEFSERDQIRSLSLKSLNIQENLSNSDSGYFTTFNENNELIMAYVDNERSVKIFDVFHKNILSEVKSKSEKKVVCIDYYQYYTSNGVINYLITIDLENIMTISNLSINEKDQNIYIQNIGDTFKQHEDDEKSINAFSLSTVRHEGAIWIITSYYYDGYFKIFDQEGQHKLTVNNYNNEFIISLEALFFTEQNTYVCVRSTPNGITQRIHLFVNEYYIKQIYETSDFYINFKIIRPFDLIQEKKYIIISKIQKDLSRYNLEIIDISPIFPLYTEIFNFVLQYANDQIMGLFRKVKIVPATWDSKDAQTPMNNELRDKISKNNFVGLFSINNNLTASIQSIEAMKEFYNSSNEEKFNLGNILLWEDDYIIVATPFDYLDIIDYKNEKKCGTIYNSETIHNINDEQSDKNINDIVIYNISGRINDPEYGSSFIMRDNKGKIQYIRPSRIKDKLNYRIIKSDEYFNDLEDDDKLQHIYFSTRFYFFYALVSYLAPLIAAIVGHNEEGSELDNDIYTAVLVLYIIYAVIGIWFKGCVHDIEDSSHTQRTCTKYTIYLCLLLKVVANIMLAYRFCQGNKRGIVFVVMLFLIYFVHLNFNFIVYCCKIKFVLRTYWLGFLFYQLSRFLILIFFVISFFSDVKHVETYIFAGILCIISAYMYMANYFNTLMKDIVYNSYIQAIFNFPLEWMNLFCCWCRTPKDLIRELDYKYCCCDSYFLAIAECIKMLIIIVIYIIIYMIYILCLFIGALFASNNNRDDN